MSSVPYVPPDTIKKVAATSGHKVRRTDFFRSGSAKACCSGWVDAVAVANFYVFLLKRLTLATSSPLSRGSRLTAISGHFGGVSSHAKNTAKLCCCGKKYARFLCDGNCCGVGCRLGGYTGRRVAPLFRGYAV